MRRCAGRVTRERALYLCMTSVQPPGSKVDPRSGMTECTLISASVE